MKIIPLDAYVAICTKDGRVFTQPERFSDPSLYPIIVAKYQIQYDDERETHDKTAIYHEDLDKVEITDHGFRDGPDLYGSETATYKSVMGVIDAFAHKMERGPDGLSRKMKPRWKMETEQDLVALHGTNLVQELSDAIANDIKEEMKYESINDRIASNPEIPEIKLTIQSCTVGVPKSYVVRP